jgi:hypothetical protein
MLVDAQVSSMKIRLSGARSSWPSNQALRRSATSGRSCSEACAVFFARNGVPDEKALDRPEAEDEPLTGETAADFFEGRVLVRAERRHHRLAMRLDAS